MNHDDEFNIDWGSSGTTTDKVEFYRSDDSGVTWAAWSPSVTGTVRWITPADDEDPPPPPKVYDPDWVLHRPARGLEPGLICTFPGCTASPAASVICPPDGYRGDALCGDHLTSIDE